MHVEKSSDVLGTVLDNMEVITIALYNLLFG